jgi:hypothetical protein
MLSIWQLKEMVLLHHNIHKHTPLEFTSIGTKIGKLMLAAWQSDAL